MHKNPNTINQVRENLSEAAYAAWVDKNFVNRASVVVNAMGKIINSIVLEIKAAEMSKSELKQLRQSHGRYFRMNCSRLSLKHFLFN